MNPQPPSINDAYHAARLVHALKENQTALKEVLDAIEKRDMTPSQIREHLGWVAESLKSLRKDLKEMR